MKKILIIYLLLISTVSAAGHLSEKDKKATFKVHRFVLCQQYDTSRNLRVR